MPGNYVVIPHLKGSPDRDMRTTQFIEVRIFPMQSPEARKVDTRIQGVCKPGVLQVAQLRQKSAFPHGHAPAMANTLAYTFKDSNYGTLLYYAFF